MEVAGEGEAEVVAVPPDDVATALVRAQRLLAAGGIVVVVLDSDRCVDAATVGALAWLVLSARRSGGELMLQVPDETVRLAELMGLAEALRLRAQPVDPRIADDPPA